MDTEEGGKLQAWHIQMRMCELSAVRIEMTWPPHVQVSATVIICSTAGSHDFRR